MRPIEDNSFCLCHVDGGSEILETGKDLKISLAAGRSWESRREELTMEVDTDGGSSKINNQIDKHSQM